MNGGCIVQGMRVEAEINPAWGEASLGREKWIVSD